VQLLERWRYVVARAEVEHCRLGWSKKILITIFFLSPLQVVPLVKKDGCAK